MSETNSSESDLNLLLCCPFCGGSAEVRRMGTHRVSMIISCSECGANVECNATGLEQSQWNNRHNPEQDILIGKIEAAENCLVCAGIADPFEICKNTLDILAI